MMKGSLLSYGQGRRPDLNKQVQIFLYLCSPVKTGGVQVSLKNRTV
jgi:hypothetical protein